MARSTQTRRRATMLGFWRARAWLVLRVVLLALGFQLCGIAGTVIVAAESCSEEVCECPLEKQGRECPPRCPQCHYPHASSLAAKTGELVPVSAAGAGVRVGLERPESAVVPSPLLSNPYRPPRSTASV